MLAAAEKETSINLAQVHQNQQTRSKALEVVKALYDQVRVVQQHRAATNGALGGNPFFESKTRMLAREINTRFKELDRQLADVSELFDALRWDDIGNEWQTVHLQWRQDQVIENFELHSHLVRQMLDFIADIGERAESLIMRDKHQQALAQYVFRGLPSFIEIMGQMRALGTHATVISECTDACGMRLRFLLQQIQSQQVSVREQMSRLSPEAFSKTTSLIDVHLCEPKLDKLQKCIEQDILKARKIDLNPDELFTRCTEIMDAHFNVMMEGLRMLRMSLDRRIEAWVHR
jgi:hypothetical protein